MSVSRELANASRSVLFRSHWQIASRRALTRTRALHDGRNRLSNFWTPTTRIKDNENTDDLSNQALLAKAGFLRQSHSGVFHLLPLGLRVQDKLERLIDRHMTSLGASKVSLSSLSSEDLWTRSGRLEGRDSEFFRLADRKGAKFLLSPTHEEEITTIVANAINSHKDLPLRLYQVTRKYRDEARPRQGLLRGREFLMKDLYTFDLTEAQAKLTYEEVRKAYSAFLDELHLPYAVADADSGKMGGNLSHEYHLVSDDGEDTIISCKNCNYTVNQELYAGTPHPDHLDAVSERRELYFVNQDRTKLFEVVIPSGCGEVNLHLLQRLLPDICGTVSSEQAAEGQMGEKVVLVDPRCILADGETPQLDGRTVLLTEALDGDRCPNCSSNSLSVSQAVEIGHTFHLSTRYSAPLAANVLGPDNKLTTVQMGCHGIGVSRLIATVSGLLADERGLNWPYAVAPFQAVVVAAPSVSAEDLAQVYDDLRESLPSLDLVIDDRQRQLGWKLNDADLIGYPFIILLGRKWAGERRVELQCRRLNIKEDVSFFMLPEYLKELAEKL